MTPDTAQAFRGGQASGSERDTHWRGWGISFKDDAARALDVNEVSVLGARVTVRSPSRDSALGWPTHQFWPRVARIGFSQSLVASTPVAVWYGLLCTLLTLGLPSAHP